MLDMSNIFPDLSGLIPRVKKEQMLQQRAKVIWFTGLSGSGKTTLAVSLSNALFERGKLSQLLDGDNIRSGINNNLGFSPEDRYENIRRIAEIAKLFKESGLICLCAFISPTNELRNMVRNIVGEQDFLEIFVSTPLEVCEKRDVKGLYVRARKGEIEQFTGISAVFEIPHNPFIEIDTSGLSIAESVDRLLEDILPEIRY